MCLTFPGGKGMFKQKAIASNMFDFPTPFGPIIPVNFVKGPMIYYF